MPETPDVKVDEGREELIFGHPVDWDAVGGLRHFGTVEPETATELIEQGYVDPDDQHNRSPTFAGLTKLAHDLSEDFEADVYLGGYVVSPERKDARVDFDSITVEADHIPDAAEQEFRQFCATADRLEIDDSGNLVAWWD